MRIVKSLVVELLVVFKLVLEWVFLDFVYFWGVLININWM